MFARKLIASHKRAYFTAPFYRQFSKKSPYNISLGGHEEKPATLGKITSFFKEAFVKKDTQESSLPLNDANSKY